MVVAVALVIQAFSCISDCLLPQPIVSGSLSPSGTYLLPWRGGDIPGKTAHNAWSSTSVLMAVVDGLNP